MKIKYTIGTKVTDNRVLPHNQHECEWERFIQIFSKHTMSETKENVRLIIPVEFYTIGETDRYARVTHGEAAHGYGIEGDIKLDWYGKPYVHKSHTNIKSWYFLSIDVDGQMTIDQAVKRFKDYEYVLYTSHSHQSDAKPYDCFRIFFPFSEPISNEDFSPKVESIRAWLGSSNFDESSLASYRAFYLPSCPVERKDKVRFVSNRGEILDPFVFKDVAKPVYVEPDRVEIDEPFKEMIFDLLLKIGQVQYQEWCSIASGMYHMGFTFDQFKVISDSLRDHHADKNYTNIWAYAKTHNHSWKSVTFSIKKRLGDDCFKVWKQNKETTNNLTLEVLRLAKALEKKNGNR